MVVDMTTQTPRDYPDLSKELANLADIQKHYFTFGTSHSLPGIPSARDEFVEVWAPWGYAREFFMGWLATRTGSWGDEFAFQYNGDEWPAIHSRHYPGKAPYVTLIAMEVYRDA